MVMRVSVGEFIKSPALYLEKVAMEPVYLIEDGQDIAVLAKPSKTPLTDSLIGLLKGADVSSMENIKKMRLDI
jgi:hypothetical protein